MSEARIARYATCVEDVTELPAGTVLVSADGTVLMRTEQDLCPTGVAWWFDTCPGCVQWVALTVPGDPHPAVTYGHDQLFAEWGSLPLIRAYCNDRFASEREPYHAAYERPALTGPFLIASVPSTTTPDGSTGPIVA